MFLESAVKRQILSDLSMVFLGFHTPRCCTQKVKESYRQKRFYPQGYRGYVLSGFTNSPESVVKGNNSWWLECGSILSWILGFPGTSHAQAHMHACMHTTCRHTNTLACLHTCAQIHAHTYTHKLKFTVLKHEFVCFKS